MGDASRVKDWYDANVIFEDGRLKEGRLEYEVTLRTIRGLLGSDGSCKIADVGCGTGPYAIALARAGHQITVSDLSRGLIVQALRNASASDVSFVNSVVADARELANTPTLYQKDAYDLVLLLGPLYHILEKEDQQRVVVSALEMVKTGGHVVIAFVTRNAHLRDVVKSDPERLISEREVYDEYFSTCRYVRGRGPSMYHWTIKGIDSFFDGLSQLALPFDIVKRVGCEGFLGFRLGANLTEVNDECFARWMDIIMETCEDEATLGASDHVLVVLRKQ